ncbi:hypothetical protein [Methanoculleus chikugoensis]|uniref:Uncharacterized protein n=1 Tax=Methanoculleus chikugoensis TaxID=118126 RepID=A0ABM7H3N9_9EURY|nr:hypothetical protein [Methanoculleus chikugoensis]BBL67224.1 hypothetical protein MchiMG62_04050 [Methanoculleus chikugoensis]
MITLAPAGDTPEAPFSEFFDIFGLATRAHRPLTYALEPLAALFAAVILAFYSLVELNVDWSTDCTHLASPGESGGQRIKPYRGTPGG